MKQNRDQKAEYLLRELGGIEDRFLHEALIWAPARRSPRVLLIAACLALLALAVPLSVIISNRTKQEADHTPPLSESAPRSVDDILAKSTHRETVADATSIDLHTPSLVWQSEADNALYVRVLSEADLTRLTDSMKLSGNAVGETSPTHTHRLWIVYGDGTVRTPYLKFSDGNLSTELFDYEIECLPDNAFTDCLADILNE